MARYTKKPVTVEAEQWTGENLLDICRLTGRCGRRLIGYTNPTEAPYCHCGAKMDGEERTNEQTP